jgi:hypothetical protein
MLSDQACPFGRMLLKWQKNIHEPCTLYTVITKPSETNGKIRIQNAISARQKAYVESRFSFSLNEINRNQNTSFAARRVLPGHDKQS